MSQKIQIRLSGTGGQGIILAGIILGEGAVIDGKEVVQTQSYGPEARGGASKAEVILSDSLILYPKVTRPEHLLLLSPEAVRLYAGNVNPRGTVIIDDSLIENKPQVQAKLISIPITRLATEEIGLGLAANIVALGALAAATKVVSREALEEAISFRLAKAAPLNIRAFQLGWKWAEKVCG